MHTLDKERGLRLLTLSRDQSIRGRYNVELFKWLIYQDLELIKQPPDYNSMKE